MTKTRSQAEVVFGQQVRDLRRAAGASQKDVCGEMERYGVRLNTSQLSKLERAERPTSAAEIVALAAVLRVRPSRLFSDSPDGLGESERRRLELSAARRAAARRLEAARRAAAEAEADLAKIDADAGSLP